jgi:hypothetical protein
MRSLRLPILTNLPLLKGTPPSTVFSEVIPRAVLPMTASGKALSEYLQIVSPLIREQNVYSLVRRFVAVFRKFSFANKWLGPPNMTVEYPAMTDVGTGWRPRSNTGLTLSGTDLDIRTCKAIAAALDQETRRQVQPGQLASSD